LSERNSFLDDVLVIIVLYKHSILQSESFKSLDGALSNFSRLSLFIYENSPMASAVPNTNSWDIHYHHDPSNPGVSKAYNEGFKLTRRLEKKWILLADQDTIFPSSIFLDFALAIQSYPDIPVFVPFLYDAKGLLSPFRLTRGKGVRIKALEKELQSFVTHKVINSGMLVSADAFERAGYDERFPLDYSDVTFCDRLSQHDPNFVVVQSKCDHDFSSTTDSESLPDGLNRFKSFCQAVGLYKQINNDFTSRVWIILPHALKQTFKWKTLRFLKIGIEHIFRK